MRRRLVAAAALCLAAPPAAAWVRSATTSGLCLWWSTRQVHYSVSDFTVNPAGSVCSSSPSPPGGAAAAMAAVAASFTTWSGAGGCTDLVTVEDGTTSSTATGLDCRNLVVFRRGPCGGLVPPGDPCRLWDVDPAATVNCADLWNCWDTDDPFHADARVIALTTVSYVESTGEIVDADMELNAWGGGPQPPGFYFTCVGATSEVPPGTCGTGGAPAPPNCACSAAGQPSCISTDVQDVVTHEAGHVLGLGHSTVAGSTMQATAQVGETLKRTLAADDELGICAIYPVGQPTGTGPQPGVCNGSGPMALRPSSTCQQPSSCGCAAAGAEGWLGLLALLLWRSRRPQRPGHFPSALRRHSCHGRSMVPARVRAASRASSGSR